MPREAWDNIYDKFTSSPRVLRYGEMMSKIRKAKNWQEADVLGRQLIQDYEREEVLFFIQQQVASGMLRSYFIHEKATPETQQVMGYYMDMLVRNKYFSDPCLFAQVLPKLQGHWNTQQIADIAQKTLPYGTRIYAEWKGQPFTLENYFLAKVKSTNKSITDDKTLQAEVQQQKKAFQQNIQLEASKLKSLYERADKFIGFSTTFEDTAILAVLAGQNSVDNQK
ncbi:MAG: hypothetical protein EAZ92_05965 [Candidatus Kapaibacterium sp.]|nr:MAG: hypothetical protein EAZ92_05965 [Candidatus Kapabacteria bacterium]